MLIGEFSHRSGVSASRIRFYEKVGLLNKAGRKSNGYRIYSNQDLTMLEIISSAQRSGFSLEEIGMLLPPNIDNWDHSKIISACREKIDNIEKLQARLAERGSFLSEFVKEIEKISDNGMCLDNAKKLLNFLHLEKKLSPSLTGVDLKLIK